MTRSCVFNINYSTASKKEYIEKVLIEYNRLVNFYIDRFYKDNILNSLKRKADIECATWLSTRAMKQASKQAIEIIKSTRAKESKRKFNRYKKLYATFKKKNIHTSFTDKRYKELNIVFKTKPEYKSLRMPLDSRFLDIQFDNNSFDCWFRLQSFTTKRNLIKVPSKRYNYFNNKLKQGYKVKSSGSLYIKDGNYYISVIIEKATPEIKATGNKIGVDIGINKLLSTSTEQTYGLEIKKLLLQLDNKKYGSKSYKKKVIEIKNYIRQSVNQLPYEDLNLIVLEDIKNISQNTKKDRRVNKKTRKFLTRWNYALLRTHITQKCEENGVYLTFVNPAYTSQTCSCCGNVNKANRKGEVYECQCGYSADADINAAHNILQFYEIGNLPFPT